MVGRECCISHGALLVFSYLQNPTVNVKPGTFDEHLFRIKNEYLINRLLH